MISAVDLLHSNFRRATYGKYSNYSKDNFHEISDINFFDIRAKIFSPRYTSICPNTSFCTKGIFDNFKSVEFPSSNEHVDKTPASTQVLDITEADKYLLLVGYPVRWFKM